MILFLFFLGLIFGSFFSALSFRLPHRKSIVKGRSKCDRCGRQIDWYDNIPLLSYLVLNGKCRNCSKKISIRYPLIELATGISFALIGFNFLYLLLFSLLFLIFIIDLEHQIIPDELIFAGIVTSLFALGESIFSNLFAGFLLALILLFIHLITKGKGMGLGDVKLAVFLGLFLGLKDGLVSLYLSFLTGGLIAIILVLCSKKKLKERIAFGPFMVISVPLTLWLKSLPNLPWLPF